MINYSFYKGFSVGDKVWFFQNSFNYKPCLEGTIINIIEDKHKGTRFCIAFEGGDIVASYERVFNSESLCRAYAETFSETRCEAYMRQITDMDSLVAFCTQRLSVASATPDLMAVQAIQQRYEQLKRGDAL